MKKNDSILYKNIFGSFTIKGLSILVSYLTTPAYLSFFSSQSILGIWMTMLNMVTWIVTFDLGIGNGLRNKISKYIREKNFSIVKQYVSSAYIILTILSVLITLIGFILILVFDWNIIFNIPKDTLDTTILTKSIVFVFIGVMIYFVLKIISSILLSIEKVTVVNSMQLITNLMNLIYIVTIKDIPSDEALLSLSIFYIISLNLPYLIITFILFLTSLKKCRPSFKNFNLQMSYDICSLGGKFFLIQLVLLIMNTTNEFLISNIYGPSYVVEYQIYFKLFYLTVTLFSLITNPIWSSVTVSYNDHDLKRIKQLRKKLGRITVLASFCVIIILFFFNQLKLLWLGDSLFEYRFSYGVVFALFCILMIQVLSQTSIANGMSKLKSQLYVLGIGAILKFPCTFFLAKLFNFGWITVLLVNVFILIPFVIIQKIELDNALKN